MTDERGFTEEERNEIIARLQAVENTVHAIAGQMDAVYQFCERFAATLDAIGGNPLFAAMLPPEVAQSIGAGT